MSPKRGRRRRAWASYADEVTGTIHLGGGGDATDEEPLWRVMLQGKRRVLYWPFALPPARRPDAGAWLAGAFARLGADVDLETWSDLSRHHPDEMAEADLLFVGGGNTFRLLDRVRRAGFEQPVRDFVARGGDYYGGSAGAILACADIGVGVGIDENEVGLTGLDLVRDLVVLPHYDPTQAAAAREWSNRRARALVGVPERSGLAVRDGDAEVIGHEPVAVFDGADVTVRRPGERWRTA